MGTDQKATPLSSGTEAPAFDLEASTGGRIRRQDFQGHKTVVLYFYPKADTPGCTKQACGFRDAAAEYNKAKVAVLGISPDPVTKVKKFADKFTLNFPLLADPDHAVAEQFGVWGEKRFMGRKYMGVLRTTFVIGTDGKIRHVFENVKPEGHEAEVLGWLAENDD